jgi:hypothetical protein
MVRSDFAKRIFRFLFAVAVISLPAGIVSAQDDDLPEFRPVPKIQITKDEKTALDGQRETKRYLKMALDLMEVRVKAAEDKAGEGDHDAMLADLGGFHALIDTALDYLFQNEFQRGKVIDSLKRYEIALRGFSPRIENLRRDAPDRYGSYILKLLKHIRENRAKAVDSFFGDAVVPDKAN